MSDKVFGDASDFYRLRIVRVDDADAPDLEWREDILYRRPPVQAIEEYAVYRVEVMALADESVVASLGEYESISEAEEILDESRALLEEMTRAQFDARFVEPE